METIIGLLFILLPVIFKLIGKKLENAGTATPPDTAGSFDVGSWVQKATDEVEPEVHPHPQLRPQPQAAPAPEEEATPSVIDFNEYMKRRSAAKPARKPSKKAPILVEEEEKPKEKVDPKKLVIYSEIMSPKYKE
ncbi:MAG: hypothetical protein E7120_01950 [Bacteroidales bacterium]|nr:hypothetical protein [Bacteroidales bacterium]